MQFQQFLIPIAILLAALILRSTKLSRRMAGC